MKLIVLTLFVVACVSSSSALRCYQCLFPGEPKCQNPSELSPETCSDPSTAESALGIKAVCLKSVVDIQGVKQITRSCSKQGGQINACSAFKDHVEHCSVCDSDLCNGSSNLLVSIWTTLVPVAIAIFMKFF
ncbi:hypothetical protein PVAND_012491 [Polypedilum vanderplanki]|uniref:Protein sleepless n=1 Tax=Polypedilum vanderplanki TaxID=319348 RepID=A0A9J6CNK0_POLVA|nr:hypothetical protein PVAND_012491 [Polypedilum vanderplanki]